MQGDFGRMLVRRLRLLYCSLEWAELLRQHNSEALHTFTGGSSPSIASQRLQVLPHRNPSSDGPSVPNLDLGEKEMKLVGRSVCFSVFCSLIGYSFFFFFPKVYCH